MEFRRRLFEQQVQGNSVFENEFDAAGIEAVLRERMRDTLGTMEGLRNAGVVLTPYLEIGAERGQRALVLENELGAEGAALDLSLDLLRSCGHYADRFGMERLPLRVCADAYRLPFRTGSLPFVFCYQTLHHFPAPEPILREVHRVLAPGGHFFFAEEPYRRRLHVPLVRVRSSVRDQPRSRLGKLLRHLFVEEVFNEEEMGVLENHGIPIADWRRALSIFPEGEATLALDRFRVPAQGRRNPALYALLWLLGGRISGLYRKEAGPGAPAGRIAEALTAPPAPGRPEAPLRREGTGYVAETGERYPEVDGVAMLLPEELRRELYPEV